MGRACSTNGGRRNAYRIMVGEPEGRRPLGRQILCFWTLSIILSLSKSLPVYFLKHNVSDTGFWLHLQVNPTRIGPK
jgi:hypothetical protein